MINLIKNSYSTGNAKENFTSFLVALAFLFNSICLLANILVPSLTNFGELCVVVILISGINVCISSSLRINVKLLCTNILVLFAFLVSFVFYGSSIVIGTLMINYIVWGIGITTIMTQRYDIRATLNYAFWIATIIIVFELVMDPHENYDAMVWTYAVFPCIAVSIIHFFYCRLEKALLRIAYIPCMIMLIKFIMHSNRGGIFSMIVLLCLVSIKSARRMDHRLKNKRLMVVVLLFVAFIIALFFEQIIMFAYKVLESFDYEISALSKMYRLIEKGNYSNNRSELYAYAWSGFLKSPLWGHGVGGFSINHGGWVHNFILQLLYEGGILLTSLILIPLIGNCVFVMKEKQIAVEEYALFVLFFSVSIPRLFFSTELWNTQAFWMLFAFCVLIRSKYNNLRGDIAA